jgi:hypothetical protein
LKFLFSLEAPVSAAAYRARSATELIDATFQIFRRNAAGLLTLSALFTIPNTILNVTLTRSALLRPGLASATAVGYNFTGFGLYFLCLLVLSAVFHTAIIVACSDAYLGKEVNIADALKRALPKAFTIFVAYIVLSLLIGIGFIFFLIPGVLLGLMWYATACAILFENLDIGQAMSRSSALSKDLKGHEFATFLLAFVIYIVGYFIIAAIAGLTLTVSPFVYLIVLSLGLTLLMPIYPLVVVLLYYDARIRKEGFDIELMAQQVGGPAATAAKPQPKPA